MAFKTTTALVALLATAMPSYAVDLNPDSTSSIKDAAASIAYALMSEYNGNTTAGDSHIGYFGPPTYWYEGAAAWGSLISYWAATNDSSYNPTVMQALLFQTGPDNNYMPPNQTKDIGNDDEAWWALACMDAVELGFPNPPSDQPQWLDLAKNVWNSEVARWNTESCNGGLKWQIFSFNAGYDYKQTLSNGALFQLSARLARYTGNQTYVDWANKSWDWMSAVGLISSDSNVYDGTDDTRNCTQINHIEWSVNNGVLLYGAAALAAYTGNSGTWNDRATDLAAKAVSIWSSNSTNGSSVLTEVACESNTPNNCNTDQIAYKGYLARWLSRSTLLVPSIRDNAYPIIRNSAQAAAKSCVMNGNETTCGLTWTGQPAPGPNAVSENLAALDVVQALLLYNGTNVKVLQQGNTASTPGANGTTGSNSSTSGNMTAPGSGGVKQNGTTSAGGTSAGSALNLGNSIATLSTVVLVGIFAQWFL